MRKLTFSGGIHPPEFKSLTAGIPITEAPAPKIAIIPLSQHTGAPAKPVVKVGDAVKVGTKIGEAQGFISANIHATISGVVKKIDLYSHPVLGEAQAVFIESDGKDEWETHTEERNYKDLSTDELIAIVREAGIVGLGGAAFPTSVKLSPPKGKTIDTVILNGAECEPYLTADHRLMLERAAEIIEGGRIILKILGARKGYIAIEENKPDAISKMSKFKDFELCVMRTKYPQGAEKQLIKAITGREVPSGGLPFDVGAYVQNVGTAFAIYEAVKFGKPLVARVVTVTGAVKKPKNLRVRIGTIFHDLIESCGGSLNAAKIIMGGPMMGIAQPTDEVPVIKGTSGILVQSEQEVETAVEAPCIRCGRCVKICPMNLVPVQIADYVERKRFNEAKELGVLDCIECGSCAYVCPARRTLVHLFKYAKEELRKK